MKTVTSHQVKTHPSRLPREVQAGETVVVLSGSAPMAQLVAVRPARAARPPVGTLTSSQVRHSEDAFRPFANEELKVWGL